MASAPQNQTGSSDFEFSGSLPNELLCLVCKSVAREGPMQMECCGKLCCRACLTELMKRSNQCCPHCRKEGRGFNDVRAEQQIKALKVKCKHCKWSGELMALPEHLEKCGHVLVPCPNGCTISCPTSESTFQLFREDLAKHLKDKCPNRTYKCPHCKGEGKYNDITTSHMTTCPQLEIPCPNAGCNKSLPRWEVQEHRQKCGFFMVPCKYVKIGCVVKPRLKDRDDHERNDQLHLHIAMETVLKQDEKLRQAETRIGVFENEQKHNRRFETFKMPAFTEYKISGNEFRSPSFQTYPGGYNISLHIYANGNGVGSNTHTSVYAFLTKGVHDGSLAWPFVGTVTVELLNQLADRLHHSVPIVYPEGKDSEYSRRVEEGKTALKGYGLPRFVPNERLLYNQATNCQYLKDDCLYFRVSYASPKPWLTCNK